MHRGLRFVYAEKWVVHASDGTPDFLTFGRGNGAKGRANGRMTLRTSPRVRGCVSEMMNLGFEAFGSERRSNSRDFKTVDFPSVPLQ